MASMIESNEPVLSSNVQSLRHKGVGVLERALGIALALTATVVLAVTVVTKVQLNPAHPVIQAGSPSGTGSPVRDYHASDMPVPPVAPVYLPDRYVLHADTIEEQPPTF